MKKNYKKEYKQEKLNERFDKESLDWHNLYNTNFDNKNSYNNKKYRQKYVLEMLGKGSGKLLDIGCGTGSYFEYLERLGYEVVGVDSSIEMYKIASSVARNLDKCNVIHGDIFNLDLPTNEYDALIAVGLIEYFPDDKTFINLVKKVLKPGGKAVITFRNSLCIERKLWKFYSKLGIKISKNEYFYREHNPTKFITFLKSVGMSNIKIRYCHFYPLPWPISRLLSNINSYLSHKMEKYFSKSNIRFLASTFIISFETPKN